MSDKCLQCKSEKTQISGQTQIIRAGWELCLDAIYVDKEDHSDCGALLAWAMMMH